MPQIQVTIAGRSYRMACGEGEEAHLEGLAAAYDVKISELKGAFGEIGDMRLHVMAAITIADDLAEAGKRLAALEAQIAALKAQAHAGDARIGSIETRLADGVARAAERIEQLARGLNASVAAQSEGR